MCRKIHSLHRMSIIASYLTAGAAGDELTGAISDADTADTEPTDQSEADGTEMDPAQMAEDVGIFSAEVSVLGSDEGSEDDSGAVPAVEGVAEGGQDEGDVVEAEIVDNGLDEVGSSEATAVVKEDADMGAESDAAVEPGNGKTEDSLDV